MPLLCNAISESLHRGSNVFHEFDFVKMKGEPGLWDHYIDFKLLKAYIRRVRPTELLRGEDNNEITRILISHQIQLLSALIDYYTKKGKNISSLCIYMGSY